MAVQGKPFQHIVQGDGGRRSMMIELSIDELHFIGEFQFPGVFAEESRVKNRATPDQRAAAAGRKMRARSCAETRNCWQRDTLPPPFFARILILPAAKARPRPGTGSASIRRTIPPNSRLVSGATEERKLVANELAAAVGENRRAVGQARAVLLAAVGGELLLKVPKTCGPLPQRWNDVP
jgi:hypothetical protein